MPRAFYTGAVWRVGPSSSRHPPAVRQPVSGKTGSNWCASSPLIRVRGNIASSTAKDARAKAARAARRAARAHRFSIIHCVNGIASRDLVARRRAGLTSTSMTQCTRSPRARAFLTPAPRRGTRQACFDPALRPATTLRRARFAVAKRRCASRPSVAVGYQASPRYRGQRRARPSWPSTAWAIMALAVESRRCARVRKVSAVAGTAREPQELKASDSNACVRAEVRRIPRRLGWFMVVHGRWVWRTVRSSAFGARSKLRRVRAKPNR